MDEMISITHYISPFLGNRADKWHVLSKPSKFYGTFCSLRNRWQVSQVFLLEQSLIQDRWTIFPALGFSSLLHRDLKPFEKNKLTDSPPNPFLPPTYPPDEFMNFFFQQNISQERNRSIEKHTTPQPAVSTGQRSKGTNPGTIKGSSPSHKPPAHRLSLCCHLQ